MIGVLFVCMGNICRSPIAEGVFRFIVEKNGLQEKFLIDSAGTHGYHIGKNPDTRAIETALKHGIDIRNIKAREVEDTDFEIFNYIVAMDKGNLELLHAQSPKEYKYKIDLLLSYVEEKCKINIEVPDPYIHELEAFERVYNMIDSGAKALFNHILKEYNINVK